MKALRQLFAVIVLTFTLALSNSAGVIHTTVPTPPPPSAPATAEGEMTTGVDGTMHTGNSDEAAAGDAVVEAALSLVQVVLSLL